MAVVFDPEKDQANIAKHGLSLADVEQGFPFPMAVIVEDTRFAYPERRLLAFARSGGRGLCLVFCEAGDETIRAISYRHAHDKELRRHGL